MIIFLAYWIIFTFITYGTNVPAGLFLPGMIIGCAIGHLYGSSLRYIFPDLMNEAKYNESKKNFIVLAIGGFMAGYTRLTYSLCVILLETSQ
jgi:H+/Cl- antiporter ClcA